jgi:hypothetical protein
MSQIRAYPPIQHNREYFCAETLISRYSFPRWLNREPPLAECACAMLLPPAYAFSEGNEPVVAISQPAKFQVRRACISCRKLIPASATICSSCRQSQTPRKSGRLKPVMTWIAAISAILGLGVTLLGGLRATESHRRQQKELKVHLAIAESQIRRGEYEAAIQTTQSILKDNPQSSQAADDQISAAMLWLENFQVLSDENHRASDLAAARLDEIFPLLDAGLARSEEQGERSADILAHIGWAHWLNWHIAQREYGPAARENLQSALTIDASNPYANAMLGNLLLQTGGSFHEALDHFAAAVHSAKVRHLVRRMQIGGFVGDQVPGARAELMKAVNDMRKLSEPLDPAQSSRILSFACNPAMNSQAELAETLTAVPSDEAWATYQWLAHAQSSGNPSSSEQDFIYAEIFELSGKNTEALEKYRRLQQQLKGSGSRIADRAEEAIQRLS